MFKYFVSFQFSNGGGNIVIDVSNEIKKKEHIEEIEKEIADRIHDKAVVMNFILLDKAVNKDE